MGDFTRRRGSTRAASAVLAAYLFAMAVVLRAWILSGFDLGFSDRSDGLIEISILEHWRNVFLGWAPWNQTFYFHPYADTLGYNDGYLFYGAVYTLLRTMFDPFVSDMLNISVFKTIGFFGVYALCRRSLAVDRPIALAAAVLFTIGYGLMVHAYHAQLQTVSLVPIGAMMAIRIVRLTRDGLPRRAYPTSAALAALLAGWFLTTYYMAWFTVFFAGLFAACWIAAGPHPRRRRAELARIARLYAPAAAIFLATFAILIVPFLAVYLQKLRETGGHDFQLMSSYLTRYYDPINVGPDNYLWGWLVRRFTDMLRRLGTAPVNPYFDEHVSGIPPLLFGIFLLSAGQAVFRPAGGRRGQAVRALALAIVLGWLCTVQIKGISAWRLIYDAVPGAHGLRTVIRYQLFLTGPILVLIALTQEDRVRRVVRRAPLAAGAVALLLVAEQLGTVRSASLSRATEAALLRLPPPPAGCASFYVVQAQRAEPLFHTEALQSLYPHNVDAMLLAELWRVPTINGYSTFNPPDWNFASPTRPDYDGRVLRYAAAHGLRRLCRLDVRQPAVWRLAAR